jgi:hypothetical protein
VFQPSWARAQWVRHVPPHPWADHLPWEVDSLAIDPALPRCACCLCGCNRGTEDTRHGAERQEATQPTWPRTICAPTAASDALDWKPPPTACASSQPYRDEDAVLRSERATCSVVSCCAIRLPEMAVLVGRAGCARQRLLPGATRRGVLGCPGPSSEVQAAASGLPRSERRFEEGKGGGQGKRRP